MQSGSRRLQAGFSLIEVIAAIVIMGTIAGMGGLLISKLAPSYEISAEAAKASATPQAAVWQIRQDFGKMLVNTTTAPPYDASCTQLIHTSAGDITYTFSGKQIFRNAALLLNNVTPTTPEVCPYKFKLGDSTSSSRLDVGFSYAAIGSDTINLPVKVSLYSFVSAPDVVSIAPDCALEAGGIATTLTGSSFTGAAGMNNVLFGGAASTAFTLTNDTSISATEPAVGAPGLVDVQVMTPEGISTLRQVFRYIRLTPNSGLAAGGDSITITGGRFTGTTGVTFGGSAGTLGAVTDTSITVTTPIGVVGAVTVAIQGTSPCSLTNAFTYN
ncbi:MAG: IPT/TIG domain-containing protein [Sulfuricella sp.]|nr:IPT/TIG domain-containing protein [Sulfuricella sp.]